ncbi:hypothetical protein MG293_018097 [Ovis ammon polii]|uniref:Uncharacterized protein n=1 Tax=Ovis ammon polii TaxID=230172 RepID=A0AAD4Y1U4_OVIAM|nr:hypothetical protein MG293_018097 [Ovis ammon polii]
MTKRKSGDSDTLIETHFLQCSAGGLNSALELGSSGSGQELDILGICQGFGFRTMPGHVNIDRSVSSGQTGASASGQRWAASMQAGAPYLQDLVGGIYAGVKGEGKPEVQTPSDILTIPPIDAKRVLPQGKPRMARGIEGTKESFGACAADSDDLDVAFGMGLEKSLHGNEQMMRSCMEPGPSEAPPLRMERRQVPTFGLYEHLMSSNIYSLDKLTSPQIIIRNIS